LRIEDWGLEKRFSNRQVAKNAKGRKKGARAFLPVSFFMDFFAAKPSKNASSSPMTNDH
jgi:hypothetical protein